MAIALDATSSSFASATGSLTWSHTCTGSNRVLVVGVTYAFGSFSGAPTVTYNGVSMSALDTGFNLVSCTFILKNPTTGANNIVITIPGTDANARILGSAVSYTGCDTTTQPDSSAQSSASGAGSAALTITTTTTVASGGCWLVGFASVRYNQNSSSDITSNRTTRIAQTKDGYGQSGKAGGCLLYDSNGIVSTGSQTGVPDSTSNATELDNFVFSLKPDSYTPASSSAFLSLL